MAVSSTENRDLKAGIVLMSAAALGLVAANSPLSIWYDALRELPMTVRIGAFEIDKPLLLWINDGLMAVFFFLVGLELKREVLTGELSSPSKAVLPIACAVGGMAVPALIYIWINTGDNVALRGWAIPAATDIAFALGVLALAGSRVPIALKVLLTAIAVIDDLGAIIVIALFYTADLSFSALGAWAVAVLALLLLNRFKVTSIAPYVVVAVIAWAALLKSGVHATLAGVVAALFIPSRAGSGREKAPLQQLEEDLYPVVAFFIVPVFGFCNAGVSFAGVGFEGLFTPISFGIAAALFFGKQIGVFAPAYLALRTGLVPLNPGVTLTQIYGVALLCGIGFTMSLFIAGLAFADPAYDAPVRLGVLGGSILSAVVGLLVLRYSLPKH
ncbi:MAG: Na+/H+ antiporter NhaA [Alphaproteobacteria bacterium]|nr:Na+/H+ antiporter NhaA [Alphaproteobacteria bacterium]